MLKRGPDFHQPSVIVDVSGGGLTVRSDGRPQTVPWSAVAEVSAGRVLLDRSSGVWIFVLAIGIELNGEVRLFVVGEVDPAWVALTACLPTALPDIAAFDEWGARATTTDTPVQLYLRDESRS